MFLRDLCICENEFHDGEYVMRFSLCVRWVEPGSDVYYSISDSGFDITDRINVTIPESDDNRTCLSKFSDYIASQVLANSIQLGSELKVSKI